MAKITFKPSGKQCDYKTGDNLLELARSLHLDVEAACGGVCACSTCHMIVEKGFNAFSEQEEAEEDQLDFATGVSLNSRLACQAVVKSDGDDLEVYVPPMRDSANPHDH